MAMTSSNLATITKFNGDNWSVWKFETQIILKGRGLYEIISGQKLKPEEQPERKDWEKQDAKAQEIIVTRIEQGPMTHILSCQTAKDMWNKLKTVYDKESAVSVHLLQQKFFTAEINQDNLSTFLSKIEEIRVNLKQGGEEISDKMTITKILMSLPEKYKSKHFRSAWESAPSDKQTLEELTSRLLLEEERMSNDEIVTALVTRTSTKLQCHTCAKVGHLAKDCYKNKQCSFCKKSGHIAKHCFFKKKNRNKREEDPVTALIATTKIQSNDCWYMDSGCTHHMCREKEYFEEYKNIDYTQMVELGDGAKLKVVGEGKVKPLMARSGQQWN